MKESKMLRQKTKRNENVLICLLIFATVFCLILLLPQVRNLIIEIGEKAIERKIDHNIGMEVQLKFFSLLAFFCSVFLFTYLLRETSILESAWKYINKYGKKNFIFVTAGIVVTSVVVRMVMFYKCRSLWGDESSLAASIVPRNLFELLTQPLLDHQSAPVLYVITVKFICSILGYSEFSLRIFSFISFLGLLVCEILFLKKALNFDNFSISVVVAITALLPHYIWYSNELKPYMGDAFFVILVFLLYFFYTQKKIKLYILTALYILLLGFSSPVLFFAGGVLLNEFLDAIFNKNKKKILFVIISGTIVLIVFGLYYHWWLSPEVDFMQESWGKPKIRQLPRIFYSATSNIDSSFIWLFTPFAFLGMFSLIKSKNKIAFSSALSLLLIFFASLMGYWPPISRLWLFLPVIILIFTPCGVDFIRRKIKYKNIVNIMEFLFFSIISIFLLVNCLKYTGDKMYMETEEINSLISYIQNNIKEDEKLYIYPEAKSTFEFKNGYNSTKIGNVTKDNIIYGKDRYEWNEDSMGNELISILENKKTYLLFQHYWVGIDKGLSVLKKYGTLTEIMNVHDTPLYYFEEDNR